LSLSCFFFDLVQSCPFALLLFMSLVLCLLIDF
jgi:hypothetical protein